MKKLYVNLDLCIGCQAHSAACHRVRFEAHGFQRAGVEAVGSFPTVCRHCEDPACVKACPREAMRKESDGTVRRSANLCSGCRSCLLACPFATLGDLEPLADFSMSKCNLCFDRVRDGKDPACVATCPTGALEFQEADEALAGREALLLGAHLVGYNPYVRRA
ncbi:MAG: 4Fe-4S dicluster domain-containing protein [Planctomycetota bacterium]